MGFWKLFGGRGRAPRIAAPQGVDGALGGSFEVRGDRLAGAVDTSLCADKRGIVVSVQRQGEEIATCATEPDRAPERRLFTMPIEGRFAPAEFLDDRAVVVARNGRGDRGTLKMDGATQLELIRDTLGVPCDPVLDLDFAEGGNAARHLGPGWAATEREFTWTDGDESFLRFDTPSAPGTYALRITAGAFIRHPALSRQDMQVFVDDALAATIVSTEHFMQFHETRLDGGLFSAGPRSTLRFVHATPGRPCDHGPSRDQRRLAFCFNRLTLVRLLEVEGS